MTSIHHFSFLIDLLGKERKRIPFREAVSVIAKFTKNNKFIDNFYISVEKFKTDPNVQFYSFVSALNALIYERFNYLQNSSFYLFMPIPFEMILSKRDEIFQKVVINEHQLVNNDYIKEFQMKVQEINNLEKEEIKKYTDNGMKITQILKWDEFNGIASSTIEELNSHKQSKIPLYVKIDAIKDDNSEFINNRRINFIELPEKITIKSLHEKFNEILSSIYFLNFNIYSLKKTHQPLNRVQTVLNQLIAIYFWQKECGICFPFSSFSKLFNKAFSLMIQKLSDSKLRILHFPIRLFMQNRNGYFIQIPCLIIDSINFQKFTQPGLAKKATKLINVDQQKNIENLLIHPEKSMFHIDLVFLIYGVTSMQNFINSVRDSCNEIFKQLHIKFPDIFFRFGCIIYRDTAVTELFQGYKSRDKVEILELNEDPSKLYAFLSIVVPKYEVENGPSDWVSGYNCLMNAMNWHFDSIKIVIHISNSSGHGISFLSDQERIELVKNITKFNINGSFEENMQIYNKLQLSHETQFKDLIKQAAKKGIMFFCINGNKKAMNCFKIARDFYYANNGCKFIIQNQFGFDYDPENLKLTNYNQKELENEVIQTVLTAVNIAVSVKIEENCNKKFLKDFNELSNVQSQTLKGKNNVQSIGEECFNNQNLTDFSSAESFSEEKDEYNDSSKKYLSENFIDGG